MIRYLKIALVLAIGFFIGTIAFYFHVLNLMLPSFLTIHADVALARLFDLLWTLAVWGVVRLWDGHFMWKRIEEKMPAYMRQEMQALKIANGEKDKMITSQKELIERLSKDWKSAMALAKATQIAIRQ